jgi:hypothetical protein
LSWGVSALAADAEDLAGQLDLEAVGVQAGDVHRHRHPVVGDDQVSRRDERSWDVAEEHSVAPKVKPELKKAIASLPPFRVESASFETGWAYVHK